MRRWLVLGFLILLACADGRRAAWSQGQGGPPAQPVWIGISVVDVTAARVAEHGLTATTGALVHYVVPGGPADRGGLQYKDVIVMVDGIATATAKVFVKAIQRVPLGRSAHIKVLRGAEDLNLTVAVALPPSPEQIIAELVFLDKRWLELYNTKSNAEALVLAERALTNTLNIFDPAHQEVERRKRQVIDSYISLGRVAELEPRLN